MTRIDHIEVRVIDADGLGFSLGKDFYLRQELFLVEVSTCDGLTGLGGTSTYGNGAELLEAVERTLAPILFDQDLTDLESFWQRALNLTKLYGPPQAAAAVDCALWDAIGAKHETPVFRLMGGSANPIPVYASLPSLPTVEAHLAVIDEQRAAGVTAFKIHLGGVVHDDIALIEAVRQHVGDDVVLLADAVGHYQYLEALQVGRALERAGYGWFEMPVEDYLAEVYQRLRSELSIPIATGEVTDATLFVAADAIRNRCWDIVRVDVCNWGGITQGRKVAALAEAFGLPCEFHSWGLMVNQVANLHVMAASPTAKYFEMPLPSGPFAFGFEPLEIRAGEVHLPDRPGLGLVPNWERLAASTIHHRSIRRP